MQITIDLHIMIYCSPSEVFAWLTDIDKWPQWGGNLVSMEQISPGPLQVGSQIRQVTKGGRKPSASIVDVTEYVPGQRFGFKRLNLEGIFSLDPYESGTRLNARFEVGATGLMLLIYKLMLKRFLMSDLYKFKKMVESTEVSGMQTGHNL